MSALDRIRAKPKLWATAAILTGGVAAGTIIGATATATASASTNPSATVTSASSSSSSTGQTMAAAQTLAANQTPASGQASTTANGCSGGLSDSGTVTAVGASSVTIDGKTYAVTSSSDIDKNGEATLSDLKVGDKVTFSTVSAASTPTIDKLHAGNES
nr:hypothetical protein [Actinomycetota bacterium]